jgi:hypothetical protein
LTRSPVGAIVRIVVQNTSLFAAALLFLAPISPAFAQEEGKTESDDSGVASDENTKVEAIRAVERGFFIETAGGVGFIITKIKGPDDVARKYEIAAPLINLFLGYDILDILNISHGATILAASSSPSTDANGIVSEPTPVATLFYLMPQLRVPFAVITTERNFLWIRAHGGFGFALPGKISVAQEGAALPVEMDHGGNGPVFGGSVGFERFTKLRHFSLGIHAGAEVMTKPGLAVAVSLMPSVKYTF